MALDAVQIVITIFLLMALGYGLSAKGWITVDGQKLLSRLVVQVGVPATVVNNMLNYYTLETLRSSLLGLAVPFVTMAISYALSIVVARLIKLPQKQRGVFSVMFAFSNSVFLGLPFTEAIFGSQGIPHALLYYIGNTILFWTVGVAGVRRDGGDKSPIFSVQTLKNLASPALIAFAASVILILLGVKLPKFLSDTSKYLGALVTPLSMLFIGSVLSRMGLKNLYVNRAVVLGACGRFLVTPALALLLGVFTPLPLLTKQVFLMQASMPVMTQCSIVAAMYGADDSLGAVGTVLTTLTSLLYVPLLMLLMPLLPL